MTHTYACHQYTSAITSNAHRHNVSQCHLQSHLPPRDTTHTLPDTGYMHFIIENVTGEHLPRCHNLITVGKNDTAVGAILNTNSEEGFSRQICTLSDNVIPVGEIAVSTTMCFNIILRGDFTQEIWAAERGGLPQKSQIPCKIIGKCGHTHYYCWLKIMIECYMPVGELTNKISGVGDILMVALWPQNITLGLQWWEWWWFPNKVPT